MVFSTGLTQRIEVLSNDTVSAGSRVVGVTPAADGVRVSVGEQGGYLMLEAADVVTEPIEFTYTLSDGQRQETAKVIVHPVAGFESADSSWTHQAKATTLGDGRDAPEQEVSIQEDGVVGVLRSVPIPKVLGAVAELRLPLLPMTSLVGLGLALLLWWRAAGRRRRYVVLDGVARDDSLTSAGDRPFTLRHDTEAMWLTGHRRRRRGLVRAEGPNGAVWIPTDQLQER